MFAREVELSLLVNQQGDEIISLRAEVEALQKHIVNLIGILYATGVEIDRYEYQFIQDARAALRGEAEK